MSKISDKIKKLSQTAAEEKLAQDRDRSEKAVNKDLEIIERILKLVQEKLIYKEIDKNSWGSRKTYVLVTEDIVLKDYTTPANYNSGTSITRDDGGYYSYPHAVVKVSGHKYHYAGDLIVKYKFEADQAMKKAEKELDLAKERKTHIENLADLEPTIKALMLNYNKKLGLENEDNEQ